MVMLMLLVLVIFMPFCVDYLLQIRNLITSKDAARFIETSTAKKNTRSNKEDVVFLTSLMAILSGVRLILSLDAMAGVVGRPKFAEYIAAVEIFVLFVEVLFYLARRPATYIRNTSSQVIGLSFPSKDFRLMVLLNTFVSFPCVLLSTTSYIFFMWYEKVFFRPRTIVNSR